MEEVIQLPILDTASSPNIPLVKPNPVNTYRYGKEENHRVMAYIAETMDLNYQEDDTEENNMYRKTSVKEILRKLVKMAQVSIQLMYEKVQADKTLDQCEMTWKYVPEKYKKMAIKSLKDAALLGGIPLHRSERDWAPLIILARRYHNICHPLVNAVKRIL